MQLLYGVSTRTHAVIQLGHRDSADTHLVGEGGNPLCGRVDDDRSIEKHPALGHRAQVSSQGSAGRSSRKTSSASRRSRFHCPTSRGTNAASAASNSAAGTRRLRRWPSRWCGTKSAIGWPCTVTVKDSPAATRRMISALLLRSSDCLIVSDTAPI